MLPKKASGIARDSWVLVWSDAMINVFLELLEEAHDTGKRTDNGFKPEVWTQFRAGIQNVYLGNEHITMVKIRSKLDYVCIFKQFIGLNLQILVEAMMARLKMGWRSI